MLTVIYCKDSSKAGAERERSYDSHIRYLGTIKDRIRFAGPLATADGARGQGDENLVGSLFVMDEPTSVARGLMQADPYVLSGVWQSVSVFEAIDVFGRWTSAEASKTAGPFFISLSRKGDADLVSREVALFGATLRTETAQPEVAPGMTWKAVAIFAAASLPEASSMVMQSSVVGDQGVETWAVPISVGSWIHTMRSS
jgi:uncharacterized protein YciI